MIDEVAFLLIRFVKMATSWLSAFHNCHCFHNYDCCKISGPNRNISTVVPPRTGFAFRCLSLDEVIGDEFEEYDDIEN